ncbi:GmrSD restriction endonuclease domain-containing protein [Pseudosporangium ferrugineum]|uniref:Uncharacterized protein with ParB-like and HNH nuclease domain n=1 Tax=Pseudosporangium ferrugineum TaxID=439699 RepID=A0A2T0RBY6_9ACTN|nr:DUF262 domain-containing protein [Pseudosporangium ferrugineum]PRY18678.1 uncharacterized protein with ParB-like and HNH nuclease domain [Pseudosporangium ferrugineum]
MADAPIMAQGITVQSLFMGRRFGIVYYQREYSWSRSDVKALISDLHQRFTDAWKPVHGTREARQYPPYFLGSIVYYEEDATTYVVDGQQRITTLHLLLIHLYRLLLEQGATGDARHLETLVRPNRGDQTFAIDIPEHAYIYDALMEGEPPKLRPGCTPSEKHLVARGRDLSDDFPADLSGNALVPFVSWLLDRVCLAGIRADGRDHGWQIFETTNDRGVRLGPLDLLKSRLLAQAGVGQDGLNRDWREMLSKLNEVGPRVPADFVKSYLLAMHIRLDDEQDRKQAADAFHEWFRMNAERIDLRTPTDYSKFIRKVCVPLGKHFSRLAYAARHWDPDWAAVFFNEINNVPHHLTAVLAAIRPDDTDKLAMQKAQLVASFLDLLFVRRLLNNKADVGEMEYDVFTLILRLRKCGDLEDVRRELADETTNIGYDFGRAATFAITPANGPQVRYLLARLTAYAEEASGRTNPIQTYLDVDRPFEVHRIWSSRLEDHAADVGGRKATHESWRNRLGGLLLLAASDCAELRDRPYPRQLEVLRQRHVLAASLDRRLHADPAFKRWANGAGLTPLLRPFPQEFPKAGIEQRQALYQRLCGIVWSPKDLGLQPEQVSAPVQITRAARRPPRARKPADTLAPLVEAGIVKAGDLLWGTRRKADYSAAIGPEGEVELPTGEIFASPDEAGAFVLNQKSCSGWSFWNVVRSNGRIPLKDIRSQAVTAGLLD